MGNPHRVPFSATSRIAPAAAPSVAFISQKAEAGNGDVISAFVSLKVSGNVVLLRYYITYYKPLSSTSPSISGNIHPHRHI